MSSLATRRKMNHCFEICHYRQNVPQHYYLLDTLVYLFFFFTLNSMSLGIEWIISSYSLSARWMLDDKWPAVNRAYYVAFWIAITDIKIPAVSSFTGTQGNNLFICLFGRPFIWLLFSPESASIKRRNVLLCSLYTDTRRNFQTSFG